MGFIKRNWLARLGTGLNKFIIGEKDANGKQTLVNSPDSITQQGDVISAPNMNDLEDRIEEGFEGFISKIWKNPDTTVAFGSTTLTFPQITGTGGFLVITFTSYRDFDNESDILSYVVPIGTNRWVNMYESGCDYDEGVYLWFFHERPVKASISNSGLVVQIGDVAGYVLQNGTTTSHSNNSYCKPIAVYFMGA